ncbi:magnesium transporter CorA family protein [bacterium]|nr:magnesium transporter CorA family protein [bacterium]
METKLQTKLHVIRETAVEAVPIERLPELITAGETVWLDVLGKDQAEFASLVEPFGFHPLSLEDAMEAVLRPKVETFLNYVFIAVRAINHEAGARPHDTIGLKLFLGERFLVSVHRRPISSIATVQARLPQLLRRSSHPSIILADMCSDVIDYFDPVVRNLEDRIEELEEASFQNPSVSAGEALLAAQREVLLLRRAAVPVRDLLHTVLDRADPLITAESRVHLRDALDEITRITDWLNILRDLSTGALTMYQAALDNQTNAIMKFLSIAATLALPLNVIVGFYGMNVANLPAARETWAVFMVVGIMASVLLSLLLVFRRKRWI